MVLHMRQTLLSAGEVAERLQVSRRTVQRMAQDGRLTPIGTMGRKDALVFADDDITAIEAAKAATP